MTAKEFRAELKSRLHECANKELLCIVLSGNQTVKLTGADILREGERLAGLSSAPAGGVILLLLPHCAELFLLQIGLVLTGRLPAILPWPTSRVDAEKYHGNLIHQFRNLPANEMITTSNLAASLGAGLPYRVAACEIEGQGPSDEAFSLDLRLSDDAGAAGGKAQFPDSEEALFLQFSGGTTGAQKAIVITAPILAHQLESLRQALSFSTEDTVVSWLPLYHDMGLIGCLWLPLWHNASSVQFAAGEWLLNPGLLIELIGRYHGTLCWLPNFAFSYLAGQKARMSGPHSLAHVRGFINCSEPVRLKSIARFVEAFAEWGVTRNQMQASYAMAENVFAVTQTLLGQMPRTLARSAIRDRANGEPLEFRFIDDVYVSSGRALAGMKVRITDSQGNICADGEAGEMLLSTESLFSGYWGPEGFVTNKFTSDGWYATGDYGFLKDGELYVIGRLKDIVIVGGQNIFPEDVETVVNNVSGIYAGRAVAFGISNSHDTESLIVVAEMRGEYDRSRAKELEKQIAGAVLAEIGIGPGRVAVVPERWIVKSTAGKISRRETRERYVREGTRVVQRHAAVGNAR